MYQDFFKAQSRGFIFSDQQIQALQKCMTRGEISYILHYKLQIKVRIKLITLFKKNTHT